MASVGMASRFSVLNVDDDFDSDEDSKNAKQSNKGGQKNNQQKKKNKKKKTEQQKAEVNDLRNMAFAQGGGKKKKPQSAGSGAASGKPKANGDGKDWEAWQKTDESFAAQSYEKDLQEALLQSRLEFEEKKVDAPKTTDSSQSQESGKNKKKKKNKEKPSAMTLQQFNDLKEKPKPGSDSEEELPPAEPSPTTLVSNPDPLYFSQVETDVQKIIQKEKITEKYRKQYAMDNARTMKFQQQIELKDKEIEFLKATNKKLESDLKEVKSRNKQLCKILAQGEMKDKAKILKELDELKQVRDELTQEVCDLNSDLEKERSKVHSLTNEQKKGGKHGSK